MGFDEINNAAEHDAKIVFDAIGSSTPSILELIKWVEEQFGVKISIENARGKNFDKISGLTYLDPITKVYRILIKESDFDRRKNFTLCHELAHVFRDTGKAYGFFDGNLYNTSEEERYCNRFAAAYLMPASMFREKWEAFKNLDFDFRKAQMTSIFKVSGVAVEHRLADLNLSDHLKVKKNHS